MAGESSSASKRRKPNWDQREIDIMVAEVLKNKHVLFDNSKQLTSNEANEVKLGVWSDIACQVNRVTNNHRTPGELRKKWTAYKSEGRGFRATKRKQGRSSESEEADDVLFTQTEMKVLECIGEAGSTSHAEEVADGVMEGSSDIIGKFYHSMIQFKFRRMQYGSLKYTKLSTFNESRPLKNLMIHL